MAKLFDRLRHIMARRLAKPVSGYRLRIPNNMPSLYKNIRKGDVVLVEGESKLSSMIKLFSQSHWSHIAMYVGDELVRDGFAGRDKYLHQFGEDAKHLLVEAFTGTGVIASPLGKYQKNNIRVCRPFGIERGDLQSVVNDVIANLGKQYDDQNILDIALILLPAWLNPFRKRSVVACLGKCTEFRVICSGMIAKAFQRVGFPIVPELKKAGPQNVRRDGNPYGSKLIMRHYSQVLPRDFDLSPNFDIIKFNIIADGHFDYKSLPWESSVP